MTYSIEPLFKPFSLGNICLANRIVMSPMTRGFSPLGIPGQNVADYYRRRAQAGVGLIITEGVGIDHPSAIGQGMMGEENIPVMVGEDPLRGWKKVVDDVHSVGGLIMPQLWHMGMIRLNGTGPNPEALSMRPSGLWGESGKATLTPDAYLAKQLPATKPMTESEIADIIAAYARSAVNAKAVGFDGITIHGAHGYLLDSFFWSQTNKRRDQWGGSVANRARFAAEVIKAIRQAVGADMPILLRWSQWKQQDYSAQLVENPNELEQLLRPLVDAGVDLFDTSTRVYSTPAFDGSDLTLAGWVRKLTGRPTMAVGGVGLSKDLQSSFAGGTVAINNLEQVVKHFERDEFDLLAVGRSLLMDPEWALKARANVPFKPFDLTSYSQLY